jgi:Skp family chaperone for outer membrane proteins
LIDEYKAKVQKFQSELEKKNTELLAKSKKIAEMHT